MNNKIMNGLISLLAGGAYVLAFSPFSWSWIGLIAPALLLYCWKNVSARQALCYGFLFGVGQFGAGTSWVYVSIHRFGNANTLLAMLITALFTLLMACYPALQGFTLRKIFDKKSKLIQYLVAFPVTWVFFEWLRGWLFSGFPWLMLGYTQTQTIFNAYAPLIGVYGVSIIVAVISGTIVLLLSSASKMQKIIAICSAIGITSFAIAFHHHAWTRESTKPLEVAMIQGNISQATKWDPQQFKHIIDRYVQTTAAYLAAQLIVWPEAAIPVTAKQIPALIKQIDRLAKNNNTSVISGIPDSNADNTRYYNAMRVFGKGSGTYRKRHLVPFGEYTPLSIIFDPIMQYFDIPMSTLYPGSDNQPLPNAGGLRIAPFICYEIAYSREVVKYAKHSQLIVVINDDSWFGRSLASSQQVEMATMRAIETGRYMLYASNTGITTIISPTGEQLATAPENIFTVLSGQVYGIRGETPLTHYGYYPLVAIMLLMSFLLLLARNQSDN